MRDATTLVLHIDAQTYILDSGPRRIVTSSAKEYIVICATIAAYTTLRAYLKQQVDDPQRIALLAG